MDDLERAKRKWKRAKDALDEAEDKLKDLQRRGGDDTDEAQAAVNRAKKHLEDAEDEEEKARKKFKRLKAQQGP